MKFLCVLLGIACFIIGIWIWLDMPDYSSLYYSKSLFKNKC